MERMESLTEKADGVHEDKHQLPPHTAPHNKNLKDPLRE